jgi:Xaa-Pro aminopeptidase
MAQFQFFDDTTSPAQGPQHIAKLRTEMARRGFDGFIVPRADEHQGEYVPKSAERLAWLTGFTGSAGTAVILQKEAALVVDGRYTVQAAEQVDTSVITPVQLTASTPEDWIAERLPAGGVLAYDPWLHTSDGLNRLERAVSRAGGKLAPVDINLVDVIWIDRPAPPQAPVRPHPLEYAGEAAPAKLDRIRKKMAEAKLDALVISDPHNLAWAFNLRGGDVGHTPLPLGDAILPKEGRASLFFDPA